MPPAYGRTSQRTSSTHDGSMYVCHISMVSHLPSTKTPVLLDLDTIHTDPMGSGTSIVANMIILLPVSSIVARNPFANARSLPEPCAKFRTFEIERCFQGQAYTQQLTPWPIASYCHSNQRVNIPRKECNKEATELLTDLVPSCCVILLVY